MAPAPVTPLPSPNASHGGSSATVTTAAVSSGPAAAASQPGMTLTVGGGTPHPPMPGIKALRLGAPHAVNGNAPHPSPPGAGSSLAAATATTTPTSTLSTSSSSATAAGATAGSGQSGAVAAQPSPPGSAPLPALASAGAPAPALGGGMPAAAAAATSAASAAPPAALPTAPNEDAPAMFDTAATDVLSGGLPGALLPSYHAVVSGSGNGSGSGHGHGHRGGSGGPRKSMRLMVGLAVTGAASLTMAYVSRDVMLDWLNGVSRSGFVGPLVLAVLFVPVSFPFLYGYSVLAIGGGFFFGLHVATLSVLTGSTLGACLSFWLSRWFMRDFITRRLGSYKMYKAIMRAVEKDAFKIIFLCRLVPIPFGIMNSILAMSRVRFSVYMVATTLGLLPEIVLLCYFGTTLRSLQDLADGNAPLDAGQIIFMVVGVLVSIVLFVILFRLGREAMREMDREDRENERAARDAGLDGPAELDLPGLPWTAAPVPLAAAGGATSQDLDDSEEVLPLRLSVGDLDKKD